MTSPSISLSIKNVPPEFTRLRQGGLYWIACADPGLADVLATAVLEGSGELPFAVVAAMGGEPESMLAQLASGAGPTLCALYRAPVDALAPALHGLWRDLARATRGRPALCVVKLPSAALAAMPAGVLASWCRDLAQWSESAHCTLLLLAHDDATALVPLLLPLNRIIDGLAQFMPHRGGELYFIHYWRSALGVVANREFELKRAEDGLHWHSDASRPTSALRTDDEDRLLCLAEERVLGGAPPLSPFWRIYDDWAALLAHALQAHAATVLFAVADNEKVDELALLLYRLRRERGNMLKLVVRETAPCLRYVDERVLLECGANLVVPANVPLSGFFAQLDAIQEQQWAGPLPEKPEVMIRDRHPPNVMGVVSPMQFRQVALELIGRRIGSVENVVVALQPMPGLRPQNVLRECFISRHGDLACAYKGELWIFLFACRVDGIESVLENLFRLPWRELFEGYRVLSEYHVAEMQNLTTNDEEVSRAVGPRLSEMAPDAVPGQLQLRPVRLGQRP